MQLTRQQTISLYVNANMQQQFDNNHNFVTKFRCNCLSCLTTIYVSFRQYGIQNIFCPSCYNKYQNKPTIVQYQYMRIIKERQLKLLSNDEYSANISG